MTTKNIKVLTQNDDMSRVAIELFAQLKNLEIITQVVNEQKKALLEYMKNQGYTELDIKGIGKINLVEKSETFMVDSEKLKSEYYNIYQECVKVRKGSTYITTKKY